MSARGGKGRSRGRARGSAAQEPPPRQPGAQEPAPRHYEGPVVSLNVFSFAS